MVKGILTRRYWKKNFNKQHRDRLTDGEQMTAREGGYRVKGLNKK